MALYSGFDDTNFPGRPEALMVRTTTDLFPLSTMMFSCDCRTSLASA